MAERAGLAVFWVCIVLLLHTYVIYPAVLMLLHGLRRGEAAGRGRAASGDRFVSILLSVYNEEKVVGERIRNLMTTTHPASRMEIVVGSDGSNDGTNGVLSGFAGPNVRVFTYPERRGKAAVLNDLVREARGSILVFTDANTSYDSDTIPELLRPFDDPTVGGVCGELRLGAKRSPRGSDGEVSYWSYENRVKLLESDIRTILGATGAVYAIRRELYPDLPSDTLAVDDFLIPLGIVRRGYAVKYTPRARASEPSTGSVSGEFRRKVRIGTANFFAIREFRDLLHPRKGFVSFALWSHKIIRWIAPLLLISLFASSLVVAGVSPFYLWIVYIEAVFLILALLGYLGERLHLKMSVLIWPYYFLAMNTALLVGMARFLLNMRRPHWDIVR